jgi:hypothetical protein
MARTMWIALLLCITIGGLVVYKLLLPEQDKTVQDQLTVPILASKGQNDGNAAGFPHGVLTYIEHGADFPNDPRALHPAKVQVESGSEVVLSADTPNISFQHGIQTTGAHIYYIDTQDKVVREVRGQVVPNSQLPNTDLSGRFVVFEPAQEGSERLALNRATFSNGITTSEIVVLDRVDNQIVSRSVRMEAIEGEEILVPLAWSSDGESLYFGRTQDVSDFDMPLYSAAYQIKITQTRPAGESEQLPQANSLEFPSETAQLLSVDARTGQLVFIDQGEVIVSSLDAPATEQRFAFENPQSRVTSLAIAEGLIGMSVLLSDRSTQLLVYQTGSQVVNTHEVSGEGVRALGWRDEQLIFTREGPFESRGTFLMSLGLANADGARRLNTHVVKAVD